MRGRGCVVNVLYEESGRFYENVSLVRELCLCEPKQKRFQSLYFGGTVYCTFEYIFQIYTKPTVRNCR